MVLNNEGVLLSWWVVYTDSILQQTIYPGLAAAPASVPQASPAPVQQATATPFGSKPTVTPFGSQPAFGAPSGQFGAASGIGQRQSVWGAPAAAINPGTGFGKVAFGSTTAPANPAFGSGATAFGSAAATAPAFGAAGFATPKASPWGSAS